MSSGFLCTCELQQAAGEGHLEWAIFFPLGWVFTGEIERKRGIAFTLTLFILDFIIITVVVPEFALRGARGLQLEQGLVFWE